MGLGSSSGGGGRGSGSSGPGDFDQKKMGAALVAAGAAFLLFMSNLNYTEITWKDFVNKHLSKYALL